MARYKGSNQSIKLCDSKLFRRILVVILAYTIISACWFFNVHRGLGIFLIAQILSMRSHGTFWLIQSSKCSQSTIASSIHNVTTVKACGNLFERLEFFNSALENVRNEMVKDGVLQAPFRNVTNEDSFVTVHGTKANFFQQLQHFAQVRTIGLEFELNNVHPAQWKSTDDHSNLIIQKYMYYPLTANDPLCTWIETPGMTGHGYDLYFHRTCNRDISINMQPQILHPTALNIHMPSDFVTYTQIIQNGVVSDIGEIFSENLLLVPKGCIKYVNKLPRNANTFPLFDEIFVISQFYGYGVFHMMVEDIPRLAIHLEFLKRNKHIRIAGPAGKGSRLGEILKTLGLDEGRLHSGWCRGKVVYVPRGTSCGGASVPEIQLLSLHYRNYIHNNFPHQQRNRIVLIRRSRSRRFTEQEAIEQVVQSATRDFNLTYSLFIDNPVPSLKDTMRLFRSAVKIVAPHGAGLSNMIFSEPGTVVIEGVCNLPHTNLCYYTEAYALGHHWHGIPSRRGCLNVVDVAAKEIETTVRKYLSISTSSKVNK